MILAYRKCKRNRSASQWNRFDDAKITTTSSLAVLAYYIRLSPKIILIMHPPNTSLSTPTCFITFLDIPSIRTQINIQLDRPTLLSPLLQKTPFKGFDHSEVRFTFKLSNDVVAIDMQLKQIPVRKNVVYEQLCNILADEAWGAQGYGDFFKLGTAWDEVVDGVRWMRRGLNVTVLWLVEDKVTDCAELCGGWYRS
jgi:hypothetical protein